MSFACPKCGSTTFEEIMDNVTVVSEVTGATEDGYLTYGDQTNEHGEVIGYICANCGESIADTKEEMVTKLLGERTDE